jgi:Alternative complex III, ActD subunit
MNHGADNLYGIMAEFAGSEALLNAARRAREHGYSKMDAFTPFPIDGLAETLGQKKSRIPFFVLLAGIGGGLGGYLMEWYAMAIDYPLNIGGRPLNSWPMYIPITFELTVLSGAVTALVAMLALNRLPEPYHPVFNAPGFDRASTDRFFLCIEAMDPKFHRDATRHFLETLKPQRISEVER